MRVAALVGLLLVLLAGCASVPPATQGGQPESGAPHGGAVAGLPADGTATPSATGSIGNSATKAAPPGAKTRANIPASRASASQFPQKDGIVPELAKQEASPPFDLASLEKRLEDTQAIGVLAKVELRNQVNDLLSQFRAFYQGNLKTTLARAPATV